MAFNGTGTFVRLYSWVTDALNSIPISSSRMDDDTDDIATGLSNCITKDGQTTITANIPMNSKKFTGLTNGSARTDSITLGQVQDGTYTALGTLGGAADAYTAAPSPAITAYSATMQYSAKIQATNLTTTPYLQISGIATPASTAVIKKYNSAGAEIAVEASDLLTDKIYHFDRNPGNTGWIVTNPEKIYINAINITAASEANKGVAEIATDAESALAADDTKMITPKKQRIIQVVNTQSGAVMSGVQSIPFDDTIPQSTEGNQYLTLAITPTNASNILYIKVSLILSGSVLGTNIVAALFQDSTAGALAAAFTTTAQDYAVTLNFTYKMTAATTSSTTFKVRAGADGVSTVTLNGISSARRLGGVASSSITITEVKA